MYNGSDALGLKKIIAVSYGVDQSLRNFVARDEEYLAEGSYEFFMIVVKNNQAVRSCDCYFSQKTDARRRSVLVQGAP